MGRPARVDDLRIDRAKIVDVDPQLGPGFGQKVRQENVGVLDDLVEQFAAFGLGDVEPEAALAAVAVLHQEVDVLGVVLSSDLHQAALAVAFDRMFDLDDVCAPVSQNRAGGRDERVLGYL